MSGFFAQNRFDVSPTTFFGHKGGNPPFRNQFLMPLSPDSLTRRSFISTTSGSLAAAALAASSLEPASAQTTPAAVDKPKEPLPPLPLEPLTAPTERESQTAPTAVPPDGRVGFAIVGLGRLSLEEILPAFGSAKRCKPVALVSGDRAKALQVAQQYGIKPQSVYDYQTYDNLKNNPDVEVIYIVLPNGLHREYTLRGAKAGKHILCEKPMANTAKEAEDMIAACKGANRKLMIAYRIQYTPQHLFLQSIVRDQDLGTIKLISAVNGQHQGGDLKQWRLNKKLSGGGSLPDVGIYCLNTIRFLLGEEPTDVMARLYSTPGDPRFKEVEETVEWTMAFPSGVQAVCSTSYGFHESRRLRVYGAEAWAEADPAFSYRGLQLATGHKSAKNPEAEVVEQIKLAEKNQFALEMDHMAECVVKNQTPYTPGEEGLQDHRIMEAIYQSARDGKTVKLPTITTKDTFRGTPPTKEK